MKCKNCGLSWRGFESETGLGPCCSKPNTAVIVRDFTNRADKKVLRVILPGGEIIEGPWTSPRNTTEASNIAFKRGAEWVATYDKGCDF